MSNPSAKPLPPDQSQREQALNPADSILVQAPAGSGKTDLLTRRFLCLLAQVEDPAQIVAITFTKAAAAEMRHRILSKLEHAAAHPEPATTGAFSMEALAHRALLHSQVLDWNLLDQPAQLRISTIDSFCRDIALQQPLLSALGDGLDIYEHPNELYLRAARHTLQKIDIADSVLQPALTSLLIWRDNNWQELETLLVNMLANRDRWMHDFVLAQQLDPEALRARLERPFANAVSAALARLSFLLDRVPTARDEALALARFACEEPGDHSPSSLAECVEIPAAPFPDGLDSARDAFEALAAFLQTQKGTWRSEKGLKSSDGFPSTPRGLAAKARFATFVGSLREIPGLESALAQIRTLPPARYTDEDWQILRACFTLLRHAAAELRVAFAEAGAVDYIEVAQIAQNVLKDPDGLPSDAAISLADGIRHILVDEFQDTSRRQHELLRRLIAAWPERDGRSCFVVGDPMQSIYFFRDADAELFPRVKLAGLEIPNADPLLLDPVGLTSNFRTAPSLVTRLNEIFGAVFAADDGSGVTFAQAEPTRNDNSAPPSSFELHLNFSLQAPRNKPTATGDEEEDNTPVNPQVEEIVALIRSHMDRMQQARAAGDNYRIAVLGRTRAVLAPIAQVLHEASIPFRAVDLEKLSARPEVLDALALARALLNPLDRVAWLGVLRAPWCGLSLSDLHTLASADTADLLARPVPDLLAERLPLLSPEGRLAGARVLDARAAVPALRFAQPTASLGTWLQQVWLHLGGAQCVDAAARVNLDLLWQSLDKLPNGEQDLLGSGLDAALKNLTAQPDPAADTECGVQLMTIHKSKGLEFEVVILPELQAGTRKSQFKLLSWLERGLPPEELADEFEEVTEFLVAPLQSKGADRGKAKAWVDYVYRDRESQEMRRLLYVAATRARDELHLFARPACKQDKDGSLVLSQPSDSLLATAWPALQAEITQRFDAWKSTLAQPEPEPAVIASIAAAGNSNLLVMPAPVTPNRLRRLPPDYRSPQSTDRSAAFTPPVLGLSNGSLYQRHEGGLLSRALGIAVHSLLEELARLRQTLNWDATRAALPRFQPRIAAQIRSVGVDSRQAAHIAAQALEIAVKASQDSTGQWILSPHKDAASEVRWAGVVNHDLRTVQVDRVFRAGSAPQIEDTDRWWIVDYKTAHAEALDQQASAAALPGLRNLFAPQLLAYAEVLRKLHGQDARIHAGLYYPRMSLFDWWEI